MKQAKYIFLILLPLLVLLLAESVIARLIGFKDGNIPLYTPVLALLFGVALLYYFIKYQRNAFIVIINCVVIIAAIELVFRYLYNKRPKPVYDFVHTYTNKDGKKVAGMFQHDTAIGYRMLPNFTTQVDLTENGKIFRTAYYHTDSFGKRITPQLYSTGNKKYSLFFGCSFAFGCYANDSNTLAYYMGTLDSNYVSYNLGTNGWGPQHMLRFLQNGNDIKRQLGSDTANGRAFYLYIGDHVWRAIGSMNYMMNFDPNSPDFELVHDKLEYKGSFLSARALRYKIYKLLSKSYTLKYLSFNYPKQLRDIDYKLTARIISESAAQYKRGFGNDNFYVVIFPHQDETILKYLKGTGVKVIDLSALYDPYKQSDLMVAGDGHPTAKAFEWVSRVLDDSLQQGHYSVY